MATASSILKSSSTVTIFPLSKTRSGFNSSKVTGLALTAKRPSTTRRLGKSKAKYFLFIFILGFPFKLEALPRKLEA
jgi:hypothetical protein